MYVIKNGPLKIDSAIASLRGSLVGKVFQTKQYLSRYCKAPGTETIFID
jgi:hypothetical protein